MKDYPSSMYEHGETSLGIYDGRPMAIGDYNHRIVETTLEDGRWDRFGSIIIGSTDGLYRYSTVTINQLLYF